MTSSTYDLQIQSNPKPLMDLIPPAASRKWLTDRMSRDHSIPSKVQITNYKLRYKSNYSTSPVDLFSMDRVRVSRVKRVKAVATSASMNQKKRNYATSPSVFHYLPELGSSRNTWLISLYTAMYTSTHSSLFSHWRRSTTCATARCTSGLDRTPARISPSFMPRRRIDTLSRSPRKGA